MHDRNSYRNELIQVAAVCLAAVSDFDEGSDSVNNMNQLLQEVYVEREYQLNKWGSRHYHPDTWLRIALVELGEAGRALYDTRKEQVS
jgi:hypothetical protein